MENLSQCKKSPPPITSKNHLLSFVCMCVQAHTCGGQRTPVSCSVILCHIPLDRICCPPGGREYPVSSRDHPVSTLLNAGVTVHVAIPSFLHRCQRFKLRSSCLSINHCYPLKEPSTPWPHFLKHVNPKRCRHSLMPKANACVLANLQ